MDHLKMLNVLAFLGMVQNYKPKRQQVSDQESLREAVKLVQERGCSIRKAAAEKNVAFESLRLWMKKELQKEGSARFRSVLTPTE